MLKTGLTLLFMLPSTGVVGLAVLSDPPNQGMPPTDGCQMHRLASIDLKRTAEGAILVPVTINKTTAYMYIEIASHMSVISQQAVSRLKLPVRKIGEAMEVSMGSHRVEAYASAREFALAGLAYPDQGFLIDPNSLSSSRYNAEEAIGVLGNGVLWTMDLELDLAHLKMNLYEPGQCTTHPVYWATDYEVVPLQRDPLGEYHFPMELDGRKLDAIFSTGNSVTTLSTDVTKRVYGFGKESPGVDTVTDASGSTSSQYRAMKLTTSGLSVVDERVRLVDPPASRCQLTKRPDAIGYTGCLYHYPLKLGNSILEKLHIYIDTKGNQMYYTGNSATDPAKQQ
jgi:hypothetical protein